MSLSLNLCLLILTPGPNPVHLLTANHCDWGSSQLLCHMKTKWLQLLLNMVLPFRVSGNFWNLPCFCPWMRYRREVSELLMKSIPRQCRGPPMAWTNPIAKVNNPLLDSPEVFDVVDNLPLFENIVRKFQERYQLHLIKKFPTLNRNFIGHNLQFILHPRHTYMTFINVCYWKNHLLLSKNLKKKSKWQLKKGFIT